MSPRCCADARTEERAVRAVRRGFRPRSASRRARPTGARAVGVDRHKNPYAGSSTKEAPVLRCHRSAHRRVEDPALHVVGDRIGLDSSHRPWCTALRRRPWFRSCRRECVTLRRYRSCRRGSPTSPAKPARDAVRPQVESQFSVRKYPSATSSSRGRQRRRRCAPRRSTWCTRGVSARGTAT